MEVSAFEVELRIPTKAAAIALILMGAALAALSDIGPIASVRIHILDLALLAFLGAALIWILDCWNGGRPVVHRPCRRKRRPLRS